MVKGASKFPIKFNSNLFIEMGSLIGSTAFADTLRKILPAYVINNDRMMWYYNGDDKVTYSVKQQVVWIAIQKKRVHCYFHVTGTRKEYVTGTIACHSGVWTTVEKFIKLYNNSHKGEKKHAVRKG